MLIERLTLHTHGPANLFDLTPEIEACLTENKSGSGRLWVFSVGSTGAVIGLPGDAGIGKNFTDWVMRAVPFEAIHRHPGNAFAHLRSTVLGPVVSLALEGGRILGLRPHLLENTPGRKRRPIQLTVMSKGDDMAWYRDRFSIDTQGWIDMVDITGRVMDIAGTSGVTNGQVFVNALDERMAVVTIENEMRLVLDTADFIDRLARGDGALDRREAGHIAAAFLGQGVAAPLAGGRLELGAWQQLMVVDLAEGGAGRIMVDVIGE